MVAEMIAADALPLDTILCGDALSTLRTLPSESVHCVITSPPYWNLRDYGVPGQIGLEPTIEEYVANMVAVFAEVRRVLRSDGVCWLNLGDVYANDGKWGGSTSGKHAQGLHGATGVGRAKNRTGLKPKDLCMLPARVALALQADGWWLRAEIVWTKSNPMPESVRDRPTRAHEMVYLLAKSERYWYDADAIREPLAESSLPRMGRGRSKSHKYADGGPGRQTLATDLSRACDLAGRNKRDVWRAPSGWDMSAGQGGHGSIHRDGRRKVGNKSRMYVDRDPHHAGTHKLSPAEERSYHPSGMKNRRDVWEIATHPYRGSHFATFPPALVEICLLAGTAPRVCEVCGAPWKRQLERTFVPQPDVSAERGIHQPGSLDASSGWTGFPRGATQTRTLGWAPTCRCHESKGAVGSARAVALDPFFGAGTVGVVARRHSRAYLGVELNPEYVAMAEARIAAERQPVLWTGGGYGR